MGQNDGGNGEIWGEKRGSSVNFRICGKTKTNKNTWICCWLYEPHSKPSFKFCSSEVEFLELCRNSAVLIQVWHRSRRFIV